MLARKYRPLVFADVVGQEKVVRTLINTVRSGQIAHAYLFSGPRGTGKTTTARIFARAINCDKARETGEPCNQCSSCRAFLEGRSMNIYEIDAASHNQVDNIRELIDNVRLYPPTGKYKVYIIDEVHMLSQAAFNAFLKTLEEPPSHAVFILATTEKHKVLPTVISRCQTFQFARLTTSLIVARLQKICELENITVTKEALRIIAESSDGALRDAITLLEVLARASSGNITEEIAREFLGMLPETYLFSLIEAMEKGNYQEAITIFNTVYYGGYDLTALFEEILMVFRNLMFMLVGLNVIEEEISETASRFIRERIARYSIADVLGILEYFSGLAYSVKASRNQKTAAEMALLQMCRRLAAINHKGAESSLHIQPSSGRTKISPGNATGKETISEESPSVNEKQEIKGEPSKTPLRHYPFTTAQAREALEKILKQTFPEPGVTYCQVRVEGLKITAELPSMVVSRIAMKHQEIESSLKNALKNDFLALQIVEIQPSPHEDSQFAQENTPFTNGRKPEQWYSSSKVDVILPFREVVRNSEALQNIVKSWKLEWEE